MNDTIEVRPLSWWERLGERIESGFSVHVAAAVVAPTLSDDEVVELCFGFAEARLLKVLSPEGHSYLPAHDRIGQIAHVIHDYVVNAAEGQACVRAMLADSRS